MINYNKAKKLLTKSKIKIKDEKIFIKDSLNRVTAKNIYSAVNYPAANNAAFDGFAINFLDTKRLNGKKLMRFKILKTIAAGDNPRIKKIKKYSAIQVMTGAIIPKVFNTIIPIEKIIFYPNKINPKFILIKNKVRKNNYIRFLGSDYKKNEKIISMGEVINSSHILAFKSLGIDRILVKKKPVILFISTGNEISNKNKIPKWKVRNSNSHYINSLSSRSFFKYLDGGILRDKDEDLLKKKINKNFKNKCDIIITNGAISAGKFDFVPKVIKSFKLSNTFKGVAIRPGKPIMFANFKGKNMSFFGLPGNPISSAACFKFFVHPYLRLILNMKNEKPIKARLKYDYIKKKNFTRFLKGKLLVNKNAMLEFEVLKGQESFKIKSFTRANTWGFFKTGKSVFKKGELIDCFDIL